MSSLPILQLRTHYSISEGLNKIPDVLAYAKDNGIHSVAITDLDNMYGWVKFYSKARAMGIKPIAGVSVIVDVDGQLVNCSLLCRDTPAYYDLIAIISKAFEASRRESQRPVVALEWIKGAKGIVVLLDALSHSLKDFCQPGQEKELNATLCHFKDLVGVQRVFGCLAKIDREDEVSANGQFSKACYAHGIPMVASYPVCFANTDDFEAHEVKVCIYQGRVIHDKSRPVTHTKQQCLRDANVLGRHYQDVPQAIKNANNLAMMCQVELDMTQTLLPNVSASGDANKDFKEAAYQGLEKRLEILKLDEEKTKTYKKRLDIEIDTICQMGFASYFLIVADFIQWAKNNHVPVGPGRGSGAGSIAAYALLITDVDPMAYDLLFERFLNPERVSMPDFDIDFCMIGRDRVIQYVGEKYGRDHVSQIITFGTMAAKAVIRDVGRVQGHPYGFVDKLAKLIPFDLGITIDGALAQEPILSQRYAQESDVRHVIDLCKKLEGLARNVGTHAGGVIIAPAPISEIAPIYVDTDASGPVTQFDKDDAERIGLVKFDFLGLRTLTIIDWALQNIKNHQDVEIDISQIALDDTKTFELLSQSNTTGVFQLESQGMKELIDRLAPDCIEDIIALVALYRPGPLQSGMVDDFVKRKHGLEPVTYLHPELESILDNTYGVILYQEQVMQIAQKLAGYSLGGADLLRRAMGKKKAEEMEKQRNIFLEGSAKNNIDAKIAEEIFSLMEKFAGYGFNKSHSAAYGLISYQTAWLKANYPTEFMASVLSSDMDNTDKLLVFLSDAKENKLKILPPCINTCAAYFTVKAEGQIKYGLSAIKGVGSQIASDIHKKAPYADLYALCNAHPKLNRRVLESLIKSGACDVWGVPRASLLASVDKALSMCAKSRANEAQGQNDLFGEEEAIAFEYIVARSKTLTQTLQDEFETLGYYLSAHPVDACQSELEHIGVRKINRLSITQNSIRIAGVLSKLKVVKTKKGSRIAFGDFSDDSGSIDVAFFDEVYQESYETLGKSGVLICEGSVSLDQFTQKNRLQCTNVKTLDDMRSHLSPSIIIRLDAKVLQGDKVIEKVRSTKGASKVFICYQSSSGVAKFKLPFTVSYSDAWLNEVQSTPGVASVEVVYS